MSPNKKSQLAGIQYSGEPGSTKDCLDAVMRFLQFGDRVINARILSHDRGHGLLLTINVGDQVAIKSGFASGYRGEGPSGFSYVLQLLRTHNVEIQEYEVAEDYIERLDRSALTTADLEHLETIRPVRPHRWHNYIFEEDWNNKKNGNLWKEFSPAIPFGIIEARLIDLALSFWDDPDGKLLTGYRRLEDIVRDRTNIDEHGSKLFSRAFLGVEAKLCWSDLDNSEQVGRGQLFIATYSAFRNPRAHRELKNYADAQLTEFLLLNHLYILEAQSTDR